MASNSPRNSELLVSAPLSSSPAVPSPLSLASPPMAAISQPAAVAPPPVSNKSLREKVIDEIIKTEEDYLRDLEIIVSMKQTISSDQDAKDYITAEDISAIFSTAEQILFLNKELYKKFIEQKDGSKIGDAFIDMAAYLRLYSVYCG